MRSAEAPRRPSLVSLAAVVVVGLAAMTAEGAGTPARQEVNWLTHLAEGGDVGAQLQLGLAYREGRYGLTPDQRAARQWLHAAASNGNAYAAMVEHLPAGVAPPTDPSPDPHAFGDLIHHLNFPSLNALAAVWHVIEESSPETYTRDALFERARDGDPLAEYQLGLRYRDGGWAVEPDPERAQRWLKRAAEAGDPLAMRALEETRSN